MNKQDVLNIHKKLEKEAERIRNEQIAYADGVMRGLDMMMCGVRDFLRGENENERTENK